MNHVVLAIVVLGEQQAHRPIEAGIGVGGDELGPERRIAEYQQRRGTQPDASIGGEFRLVDLREELDALAGDIRLDAGNGFRHRHRALDTDDAVVAIGARRDGNGKHDKQHQQRDAKIRKAGVQTTCHGTSPVGGANAVCMASGTG